MNLKATLAVLLALGLHSTSFADPLKPRIIVLTDISPTHVEPDDMESIIRLFACADLFEIEGLVATTGWSSGGNNADWVRLIHDAINAYEKDLPNLQKRSGQKAHLQDETRQQIGYWPSPDYLRSVTVVGSQKRGMGFIGKENNTPGSDLIIKLADEPDERPIWVQAWGGGNTLAQAIWRVKEERTPEQLNVFLKKLRFYTITDQDRGYQKGTPFEISSHQWLRREFEKDLFFLWDESAWKYQNGTGKNKWNEYATHIQGHGHLGSMYPKYKFGVEGDTPAFLYVWPNGLNEPEHPGFGSWGGYFEWGTGPDGVTKAYVNQEGTPAHAISKKYEKRFYPAIFNDFAARMDWVKDGAGNRNPVVSVNGDSGIATIKLTPAPGASVWLDASASKDPDSNNLIFSWWILTEAGTYTNAVTISGSDTSRATVTIPSDAAGKSIHVICEVTDDGTPNLTSYRRVIIEPAGKDAAKPQAASGKAKQSFKHWLYEYLPKQFPQARMIDHKYWLQGFVTDTLVANWTEWTDADSTLKAMEAHNLTPGKSMFIEQKGAKKTDWATHPAVTHYEGSGYYISGYDPATMRGWDGKGLTVIQFNGDAKALAQTIALAWARETSFENWLYQFLPIQYPKARMAVHHNKWKQAHITDHVVASWEQWKAKGITLKELEKESLAQGKAFFIEQKGPKQPWADHPAVTYYEGAGYYCSGYDQATMSGWGVEGLTVIQFDGDTKELAKTIAKAWTK